MDNEMTKLVVDSLVGKTNKSMVDALKRQADRLKVPVKEVQVKMCIKAEDEAKRKETEAPAVSFFVLNNYKNAEAIEFGKLMGLIKIPLFGYPGQDELTQNEHIIALAIAINAQNHGFNQEDVSLIVVCPENSETCFMLLYNKTQFIKKIALPELFTSLIDAGVIGVAQQAPQE